jgi:hypothetical protein
MKIYSPDNSTVPIIDGSTGSYSEQRLNLSDYDISYSYYSEDNEFTKVKNASDVPPFRDNMVSRIELNSK